MRGTFLVMTARRLQLRVQVVQWPWHWGDWYLNATVLLDARAVIRGELDVITALEHVPQSEVSRMRDVIEANAQRLQWSAVDSSDLPAHLLPNRGLGDAFDIVLREAWAASQRPGAIAHGRRLMQANMGRVAKPGYCGHAGRGGNCENGTRGSFAIDAYDPVLISCFKKCQHCKQCRYFSASLHQRDCSWFAACDMNSLHQVVPGFETVAMAPRVHIAE